MGVAALYMSSSLLPGDRELVWAGFSPAGAEVEDSRLSAGVTSQGKSQGHAQSQVWAGYQGKVVSVPGLMRRKGQERGRVGLLMWFALGEVIANCFRRSEAFALL